MSDQTNAQETLENRDSLWKHLASLWAALPPSSQVSLCLLAGLLAEAPERDLVAITWVELLARLSHLTPAQVAEVRAFVEENYPQARAE